MNVVDIIIVLLLGFGFLIGFKRGFTKQLVCLCGVVFALVFAFILKNPVSVFLYNNLPFFNFGGVIKGVTVLNILLYEIIAFFIVFSVLMIIIKILLMVTSIFESILKMTIILGFPSKLLGGVLGVLQNFIIIFVSIYVLSLPVFNLSIVNESKVSNIILDKTPILSNILDDSIEVFNEFAELKDEYIKKNNTKEFNQKAFDLLLENKIISEENAQKLIDSGKLSGVVIN